jgi:hypothetical protein
MIGKVGQRMDREALEAVDTRNFEAMADLVLRKIDNFPTNGNLRLATNLQINLKNRGPKIL